MSELENEENIVQSLINQMDVDDIIAINSSVISGLRDLQHQIRRKQNASLKQLTLEESLYNRNNP
nr:9807_t:CDS:2 [Entrophospora candida]